jgi:hypothetical protein
VAVNLGKDARRSEEGKFHWRCGFVASTVAFIPAINGESQWLTAMRWRYSGTWHKAGTRRSPTFLSDSTVACAVRWPDLFTGQSYPRREPLPNPKRHPHVPSTNLDIGDMNRGGDVVGGEISALAA